MLISAVVAATGYLAPLAFLLAAVIAVFSAFSYAELVARFPYSAGEAVYIDKAFGRRWFTQITGIVSAATMATGIVGYFHLFFDWPAALITGLFVATTGAVIIWGIEESAWVVTVVTLLEAAGLLYIVFHCCPIVEKAKAYFPVI